MRDDSRQDTHGVVIVDDDRMICDLLAKSLDRERDLRCDGIAQTPSEARSLVTGTQPDVILLDGVEFHNRWLDERRIDPIEFASELVQASPQSHLLLWTSWTDPSPGREKELNLRIRARRAGAEDLILKEEPIDALLDRIRAAVARGAPRREVRDDDLDPMLEAIATLTGARSDVSETDGVMEHSLTPAQRKWATVLARGWEAGMTVPEMAKLSHIAETTLRKHAQDIRGAWGVHGPAQFVAEARRRGFS
jgi:DNA-binding NarL/FixJ family response regulator